MKTKVVIASHNSGKAAELCALLGDGFEVFTLADIGFVDEIEENGETFEENAIIKARAVSSSDYITIADDSGLTVDALGGAPGIYSMRWSGGGDKENNKKLLFELDGLPYEKRKAAFVCCVACIFPDKTLITEQGKCEGIILEKEAGDGGFGYDPLFYYEPKEKSFAQLSRDEKSEISHRGLAMRALAVRIAEYTKK